MAQYQGGPFGQQPGGVPPYAPPPVPPPAAQFQPPPPPPFAPQPQMLGVGVLPNGLRLGGVGARIFAAIADGIILSVAWVALLGFIVGFASAFGGDFDDDLGFGGGLVVFIASVLTVLYWPLLESLGGQTLGKKMFGVKVVHLDGSDIGFGAAFLRFFLWIVDGFPYVPLVGLILVSVMPKRQRIGDMAANTIVIKSR